VVGRVSALPLVTTDIHQIGEARIGGRLFVLRAMGSVDDARRVHRTRPANRSG
jgi:hypothetical protein